MISKNKPLPLYYQLKEEIKSQIENGYIHPGDKLPSEPEMVEKYGIARLTIREALSQLVNEGYLEKRHGKGTYCKSILPDKEKINIDVLLDTSDSYFIPYYIRGINGILSDNNCSFIFHDTRRKTDKIEKTLKVILTRGSSGIIMLPGDDAIKASEQLLELFRMIRQRGIPVMLIDTSYTNLEVSSVVLDYVKGGYIAAEHLIQLGHKKIGGIFYKSSPEGQYRKKGLLQAMIKYELQIRPEWFISTDGGFEEDLRKLLSAKDRPTSFVCFNDEVALRCFRIIKDMALKVPEDISLVGFDNSSIAKLDEYMFTSVNHPKDELARLAAEKLLGIIHGDIAYPYTYIFEPELVMRRSTSVPSL